MKIHRLILIISLCWMITACRSSNPDPIPPTVQTPTTALVAATETKGSPNLPEVNPATPTPLPELPPTEVAPSSNLEATPQISTGSGITGTNDLPAPSLSPEVTPIPEQPAATEVPGDTPPQEETSCSVIAAYYQDVTIPDGTAFQQGESFVKTWRIRNVGTCNWDAGYSLVFAGGEIMNAPMTNPLGQIPPGAITDISVTLTAPNRGGTYRSNWEFRSPSGEHFGVGSSGNGPLWAEISVIFFVATPESPGGDLEPTPEPVAGACAAVRDQSYEQQVLGFINQGRANLGLSPLSLQPQLSDAAVEHSTDMACNNFVNHVGSDGNLWYARVERQGYANYNSARENIYVGNPEFGGTPTGAYSWWFNSSVHYANMFNPDVSEIGIGYVSNPDSEYVGYYTTVFARP